MNRIIVIQQQDGEEKVLSHFRLKPGPNWNIVIARSPGSSYEDIFHTSFKDNHLVLQSSTDVERQLRFFPSWSIKIGDYRSEIVHGQDLLESLRHEILASGLI